MHFSLEEIDALCRAHLSAGVERTLFVESGSSHVRGLVLDDGRAVVVKVFRDTVREPFLRVLVRLQAQLAASGFPAPQPWAGPLPLAHRLAVIEDYLPRQRTDTRDRSALRTVLARELARFIDLAGSFASAFATVGHPMASATLYPTPHSEGLDFATTRRGADWIDRYARCAQAVLQSSPPRPLVVAHCDWRVQNLSLTDGLLTGVYDWDAVALVEESVAVANAAASHTVDWTQPDVRFPGRDEIESFVEQYQQATPAFDRTRLDAHLLAFLAYSARCEHAVGTAERVQRDRLADLGPRLAGQATDA